jgi:glycerophosphoryl diester phosphodiesterase
VVNVAHRGASGHAPEHTFAAYDRALAMGADYIEQDLQLTADGELVVIHDDTLDRTTDGSGPVGTATLAEIRALDAGSWFAPEFAGERVPTLDALFARYGTSTRYYIEPKAPDRGAGMAEQVLETMDRHGLREPAVAAWQVLLQSFSAPFLHAIHALDPRLPLIQLYGNRGSEAIRAELDDVRAYAVGIGPYMGSVDAALVAAAHSRGLVVHPFTLTTVEEHERYVALGVDGAFSNYPDRFAAALGR